MTLTLSCFFLNQKSKTFVHAVYSDQLPADIVEKLSADSNYYVEEAFKLAKLPADWIGIDEEVISEKLKEGAVPNVVYEVLAENDTASIRALIKRAMESLRTSLTNSWKMKMKK